MALQKRKLSLKKRMKVMPEVAEMLRTSKTLMQKRFDDLRQLVEPLLVGTKVMAMDHTRSSKWDPIFEGPFEVVERHNGGAYTLKDLAGNVLDRRRTIDMLKEVPKEKLVVSTPEREVGEGKKLVAPFLEARSEAGEFSDDSTIAKEQERHWEVEGIIDHEKEGNSWKYLVKWSDWGSKHNSWVAEKDFNDLDVIKKYW